MCIFLKAFSKDCPVHLAHQAHIPSFVVCLSSKTFHIFLWHDGATLSTSILWLQEEIYEFGA